jgi:hypothetical protein
MKAFKYLGTPFQVSSPLRKGLLIIAQTNDLPSLKPLKIPSTDHIKINSVPCKNCNFTV